MTLNTQLISKTKITLLTMWMTALSQAAIALYLPALPNIVIALNISPAFVKATITIFLLGFGVSQLVYGPLSDRYGRKPILLVGIAIFCLGCFLNLFVHTEHGFLFTRLLQGLGAGSIITISRCILRDCFSGRELASAASYLSMGFAIGLGVSPIIGAYLQSYIGWQADFAMLLLAGLTLFFIIWRWLPETSTNLTKNISFKQLLQQTFANYSSIITDWHFLRFLLGGIFAYSVVVAYNVMSPFLIQAVLHYSANTYGWLAILVAIPYYSAASINRKLVLTFGTAPIFILGTILIIIAGLLMLLTTFVMPINLTNIILPIMIATFGQALIFSNTISEALHNFPSHLAGKASAMFSSMQMLIVGFISAIFAILPGNSPLSLALVLLSLGLLSGMILFVKMKNPADYNSYT